MRAGGQHAVRPVAQSFLIPRVEFFRSDSEVVKIASDVIQRDQAVVAVEGSVFKPLRHHWARELLKFHGEGNHSFPVSRISPFSNAGEEHFTDEIKDGGISGRASPL